ncbi:DUF1254 domain-containing protein [Herbiconiux sp. CPCC 205763]|uniref:DUF1254 domain-containing protein n=1 Tax=Herbiconiux aconitum TaxID=2970913 RepID=A0ABT2GVT7_9MICO|nr:DUF1254 domain-containing protein [Herbiconiux aconitum]MCS5719672.1 DUF1254 domain-containing protein [Herbiconiux aconitum]
MSTIDAGEIRELAAEAFSYLYPIVTMDVTRMQLTDTTDATAVGHSAPNAFSHVQQFPPADFRSVVAPNFDTLYSVVWLDLEDGPIVLGVADSGGRYYLLPLLDMWTDVFAVPGKRTTGTGAGTFVIAGPDWSGDVPAGAHLIRATTSVVWLIGRTQTDGPADYDAVHRFQSGLTLSALDGGDLTHEVRASVAPSGVDLTGEPLHIVNGLSAVDFLGYAARLVQQYPPHATDFSVLARIARLGFMPGEEFDASGLDADGLAALEAGKADALAHQLAELPTLARVTNGWVMNTDTMGVYGNFYLKRAIVAMVGLGANPAEDAVYPMVVADSDGSPIVGEKSYLQHFEKTELPPVDAFWSVTMYDKDSFQAANPLDRFALGDRDPLVYNPDGSLDLYYSATDPGGDRTANWLPAPAGPLRIIMRLYSPQPSALDGTWNPPALKPVVL